MWKILRAKKKIKREREQIYYSPENRGVFPEEQKDVSKKIE